MSLAENVVGSIIVIFFLLIGGYLMSVHLISNTQSSVDSKQVTFFDDQNANAVNTLLRVTDPHTGKPMASLVGNALYYHNTSFRLGNTTIDVNKTFTELLDRTFGKGKYYAIIRPQIKSVGVRFIIDGSDSMDDERTELANNLWRVAQASLGDDREVDFKIYMLKDSSQESTICAEFSGNYWSELRKRLGLKDNESNRLTGSCKAIDGENYRGDLYLDPERADYRNVHSIRLPYSSSPTNYSYFLQDDFMNIDFSETLWQTRALNADSWYNGFVTWKGTYYDPDQGLQNLTGLGTDVMSITLNVSNESVVTHRWFSAVTEAGYVLRFRERNWLDGDAYPQYEFKVRTSDNSSWSMELDSPHSGLWVRLYFDRGLFRAGGRNPYPVRHEQRDSNLFSALEFQNSRWYTVNIVSMSNGVLLTLKHDDVESRSFFLELNQSFTDMRLYFELANGWLDIDDFSVRTAAQEQFYTSRNAKEFYESDWASGTAYASYESSEFIFSKINLLFPMSEELASSSKPHECIVDPSLSDVSQLVNRFFCDTCTESCDPSALTATENRSLALVDKATRYIQGNLHVVNPIRARGCNYKAEKDERWWSSRNAEYYRFYLSGKGLPAYFSGSIPDGVAYCADTRTYPDGTPYCGGCELDVAAVADQNDRVCFQLECQSSTLREHMDYMANATGGQIIELEEIHSLSFLVRDSINRNLDKIRLEFGERHDDKDRRVYKRIIPLPEEGYYADFFVWVYDQEAHQE